jgi:hypothetical protein
MGTLPALVSACSWIRDQRPVVGNRARAGVTIAMPLSIGFAVLLRLLLILLFALGSPPLQAQRPPKTPFVARGSCPFECCQLGSWIARDTLPAYSHDRPTGVPLFRLLPGELLVADSADFYTLALGLIRVRRPFRLADYLADEETTNADAATLATLRRPLAGGDTVYLVGEVTEVGERVWFRGVSVTVQAFWAEPTFDDPKAPAALVRPIVHEWWVHISSGGRSGWIQAWNRNIEGTDACA